MRVLAWPLYTYPGKPIADSGYLCFRNLIRAIPEWDWQIIVPGWAHEQGLLDDDLDDLPNVEKVPVELSKQMRVQEATVSPEAAWRFSPQCGDDPVDVVICGSNQIAAVLANAWSIRTSDKYRPLIVAWDLMTRDDHGRGWHTNEAELLQHFAGACMVDVNVFGSEMMRWMTQDMLRKQFSPSVVREVLQNRSELVYAGVPAGRICDATKGVKKRDKFTVFYAGRMGSVKRVDELTEIADLAFQYGRDMQMVVCTGSIGVYRKKGFEEKFPMVELHVGLNQEEAWKVMAECHAGFMWSRHEMIGSGFIEQMVGGLPIICTPHRWIESLLPPEYPYWADSQKVAGAQLRGLYERWKSDPDTYDEPMRPWTQYVKDRYDSTVAGGTFQRIVEERRLGLWRGERVEDMSDDGVIVSLARDVLTEGMTFPQLIDGIQSAAKKRGVIGNVLLYARSNPNIKALHAARSLGWTTVGPGDGFTFTRASDADPS